MFVPPQCTEYSGTEHGDGHWQRGNLNFTLTVNGERALQRQRSKSDGHCDGGIQRLSNGPCSFSLFCTDNTPPALFLPPYLFTLPHSLARVCFGWGSAGECTRR
eukprot:gene17294-biopygen18868